MTAPVPNAHSRRGPFRVLWTYRHMLIQTTWNEIRTRYAGLALGLAWLVVYPLLFLSVYSLYFFAMVSTRGLASGTEAVVERVLLIFCGLIPFLGFAETLSAGTQAVSVNSGLIKNTLFPIDLIPVKTVLTAQCTLVVGMAILIATLGALGRLTWWALLAPVVWILQLLFSIGLIWILSSLHVFFRDLQNIISVSILMLMLISPIAWKGSDIPQGIMPVMVFNPLYYMIVSYQECLLYGRFPQNGLLYIFAALAIVLFYLGYWFFSRMKRIFSDNV